MITLRQIAAQHMDRVAGGDVPSSSPLSFQQVIFQIRQIANLVLKVSSIEKYNDGDRSAVTNCIATYELTLQNDSVDGVAFVTLPDFYISLPYNRGVHRIFQRALKQAGNPTDKEFTIMHQPAVSLKTRTARYPGMNYCWIEGFKVKFYNMYAEPGATNKVVSQLIVAAPDQVGEDDALPIMPETVIEILTRLAQIELNPALKVETDIRK